MILSLLQSLQEGALQNAAVETTALVALLTAVGWLLRGAYRASKRIERGVVELVGTEDHPSLRDSIDAVTAEVAVVKKELYPNSGSSLRDDVQSISRNLEDTKHLALVATNRAEATAKMVEAAAAITGAEIVASMGRMREEIAVDAAERTAASYELLAEHGGPDLRLHATGAPHAHALPGETAPPVTGGPVEMDESS